MVVKKNAPKAEVAADTSTDREHGPAGRPTVAYRYVGGLDGVLVVVDGNAYQAARGGVVTMPQSDALDRHPDFIRVPVPEGEA